jgi:hypothetical protein
MEWNYFPMPGLETSYNSFPVWATNVFSVPVGIFWGIDNALVVDTTNLQPAGIQYAVIDTNWIQNITFDNGTILFCVSPNWASVSAGGSGPGSEKSYLICGGDFSTDAPNGRFEIYVDSGGSNLVFGGFINGISTTYASTEISWTSNTWHQLGFEYKSGRSTLRSPGSKIFVDSGLAATGGSVTIVPALGADSNGFCTNVFAIGSDGNGMEQGRSSLYDMVTWSAPYGGWYTNDWLWLSNALVAWQSSLGGDGGFGAMMGLGNRMGLGMDTGSDVGTETGANLGYMDGVTYTTNYSDFANFWLAIGMSGSSLQPTIQNTQSNLTYNILTNSILDPNLGNWNVWQTLTASNSVIVAPPLTPGPSALFFDAALVWSTTTNGLPDWYEMEYFGNLNQPANGFYDGGTLDNGDAYTNGIDPNIITFTISCTNQYANLTSVPLSLGIQGGVPYNWAVTLDNTNFGAASWTPYTSSNITANLGTTPGWHTVWVGLRGLPALI